jgi:hypothetical protein
MAHSFPTFLSETQEIWSVGLDRAEPLSRCALSTGRQAVVSFRGCPQLELGSNGVRMSEFGDEALRSGSVHRQAEGSTP